MNRQFSIEFPGGKHTIPTTKSIGGRYYAIYIHILKRRRYYKHFPIRFFWIKRTIYFTVKRDNTDDLIFHQTLTKIVRENLLKY